MMCGWKDCLCCSFWISSSMKADLNVFKRRWESVVLGVVSVSSTCFVSAHISEWQYSHQKRDDGVMMADPLIQQHGQLQNMLLTLHWHLPCETVLIDITLAELLSFRNKIAWVFESRSQVQFLTINGAALMETLLNICIKYSRSRKTYRISSHP